MESCQNCTSLYYPSTCIVLCMFSPREFTHLSVVMSGRGHRRLRLSSRKNYERKKYRVPPLTLTASIPQDILSVPAALPSHGLSVSLPLSIFRDVPVATVQALRSRLAQLEAMPSGLCTPIHNCYGQVIYSCMCRVERALAEWCSLSVPPLLERNWAHHQVLCCGGRRPVINSVCGNVSRGNCRGNKHTIDIEKENTPLPKRRRYYK